VGLHGLPPRTGKLPGFDRFDATFFSVHGKQAQVRLSPCSMLAAVNFWNSYGLIFKLAIVDGSILPWCLQRMDPQLRKLLEVAYEAWVDSGRSPGSLLFAAYHRQLLGLL
jgi:fatty acid synthase